MQIVTYHAAVLHKTVPLDDLNVLQCTAACQRVTGMGMSVKADLAHCLPDFLSAEDCRARNVSACERLACYQDIRSHTFILTCEHGSRLSDTGNNLIEDQKRTIFITELSDTLPESLWRYDHTAGCKDGL